MWQLMRNRNIADYIRARHKWFYVLFLRCIFKRAHVNASVTVVAGVISPLMVSQHTNWTDS